MERINKIRNKKQQFIANKASKLPSFASILKLTIALALFFIAAFMISGAGITAENGALNVSNNLLVNTNTLFVDSANNRVGIGTNSPTSSLQIKDSAASARGIDHTFVESSTTAARLTLSKARGSIGAETAILSGDFIGNMIYQGYNGSAYATGAAIQGGAEENWGTTARGTFISFRTVGLGTTAVSDRVRITANGSVGIS